MANVIIATPGLGDAATLTTAGTVAPTLPLANLQDPRPSKVSRWTSLTNVSVIADLGASVAINLVALLAANWSSAAEWRIRIADTEANLTAAPTYDSGLVAVTSPSFNGALSVTGRWVRIDVSDPTNPDGFFEAGRLYIAGGDTFWQPDLNVAAGDRFAVVDDNQVAAALSGALLTTRRNRRRAWGGTFDFQTEDELYSRGYRMLMARGLGRDLLFVRDADASAARLADQTIYGVLRQADDIVHREAGLYGWSLLIEELT